MFKSTQCRTFAALAVGSLAILGGLCDGAHASILVNESFSHLDGNLVGQTPETGGTWTAFSGAGATPVQVAGGSTTLVQGSGSREDADTAFDGGYVLGAGGKLYAAFDLTVSDPGAAITDVYFATFLQGTSSFDARVWITAPSTTGYRLALSNDNSITDGDGEVRTVDLAFGTTYRVVTSYDYDAKTAQLWLDPVSDASTSIAATDPGFSDASFAYAFRQGSGNTTQVIDNLTVATTFDEARTGVAAQVPEPASLGLLGLGAVALISRRRK